MKYIFWLGMDVRKGGLEVGQGIYLVVYVVLKVDY